MSFDEIRSSRSSSPRRPSPCRRCQTEGSAAVVSIVVRDKPAYGDQGSGKSITSKSVRMCEPCAVAVFRATACDMEGQP